MKISSLRTGQLINISNIAYKILRVHENNTFQLERNRDLAIVTRSRSDLLKSIEEGNLEFISGSEHSGIKESSTKKFEFDLSCYPDDHRRAAFKKLAYVMAVHRESNGKTRVTNIDEQIATVCCALNDLNPPKPGTVYKWWRKWLSAGQDIRCFIPSTRKSHYVYHKFRGNVEKLVFQVLEEEYLCEEETTLESSYDELVLRIKNLNNARERPLSIPSRSTFYRIAERINKFDKIASKKGMKAAKKIFRTAGKGVVTISILERVEVDHTRLDVFVIDIVTGETIGRPYLTLLIDVHSRMILGFYIGFEPPSELSVMLALRNSILPKANIKERFPDLANEWGCYGVPLTLVTDNGLEFHSSQLRRMCAELNIEILFCPRKSPEFKGCVERVQGTLNREVCHILPGTSFSNIVARGDYPSQALAKITLEKLEELITQWVVDIYHQRKHGTTKKPPSKAWEDDLQNMEPMLPESRDALDLVLAKQWTRTLSHDGIVFQGLRYNSEELLAIRIHPEFESKVRIRVNPQNMGFIWVIDDFNGDCLKVPCTTPDYATNLSLLQHKLIRRTLQKASNELIDENALLEAKRKFREKVKKLKSDKLTKNRTRAARYEAGMKEQTFGVSEKQVKHLNTPHDLDLDINSIPNYDAF